MLTLPLRSLETEEFDEVVVVADSDDGYSHKKLHRQYTSGSNSPDIASPEFNGKRIACTATAAEYDPVSVAVDIDVKCELGVITFGVWDNIPYIQWVWFDMLKRNGFDCEYMIVTAAADIDETCEFGLRLGKF